MSGTRTSGQRDRYVPDGMADPASGLTIEIVALRSRDCKPPSDRIVAAAMASRKPPSQREAFVSPATA